MQSRLANHEHVLAMADWRLSAFALSAWILAALAIPALAVGCSSDDTSSEMSGDPSDPVPVSMVDAQVPGGIFAERIAPILDANCASCHGDIAPYAALTLGPSTALSAEDILAGLIGVASAELPDMAIIEPGDAEASYLYRKISATHAELPCPETCGNPMPPAGPLLAAEDVETIRAWIQANAEVY